MYFATDENNLVISYGYEEYPNAHYVDEAILPESWLNIFKSCRLGYVDGEFFVLGTSDIVLDDTYPSEQQVTIIGDPH